MSQWGTPKTFGPKGAQFVAVPHVSTNNCWLPATPDMLIDSVHVIARDSIDVDGTSAQAFIGKRYAEWLAV